MKKTLILSSFILILAVFGVKAEDKYIIKLNDSVNTLSADNITIKYITVTEDELPEYLEAGVVEFYEPEYTVELFDTYESTGTSAPSWNNEMIKISKAWDLGCFGNDVKVAVIDSGVNAHDDLKDNLLPGYNFASNNTDVSDNIGHGTYVSGIIAAKANGSYIDGVANHAKIVPLKCFDTTKPSPSAALVGKAIRSAVDDFGCKVINMSFGGGSTWANQTLADAVNYAISKNCIVVAAVGNSKIESIRKTLMFPAAYDNVVGVGAVDANSVVSYFSHYNASVDVVAPGEGIESIGTYSEDSGTSFSAPQVSALAAIAACIDKDITPQKFSVALTSTCTDLGTTGRDNYYGYGLVNAEALVDKLLENTEVFISPFSENNGEISSTVYNNTENLLQASAITGEYESTLLKNSSSNNIIIGAKQTQKLTFTPSTDKFKLMIWNNASKISPLALYREYLK